MSRAYKGISSIPTGQHILHIPVYVDEGVPDESGDIHLTSDYPLESWWSLEEIIQVIDPISVKQLAEKEKNTLEQRIKQLNEILEEDV